MNSHAYLRQFFYEKDLDNRVYEVTASGGTTNWICTQEVIDVLLNSTSEAIQDKAANIVRTIDLANGDLHHFLRFIAGGIAMDLSNF